MSDVRDQFLQKLYDMSKGEISPIDRFDVGKELNLSKQETDVIVDILNARGKIKKVSGTVIMLTLEAKNEMK